MKSIPIILPPLGMKSESILFGAWLVNAGDEVREGDELYEVEADKATVVLEAAASGVLAQILVTGGEIHEGEVLGYLDA